MSLESRLQLLSCVYETQRETLKKTTGRVYGELAALPYPPQGLPWSNSVVTAGVYYLLLCLVHGPLFLYSGQPSIKEGFPHPPPWGRAW